MTWAARGLQALLLASSLAAAAGPGRLAEPVRIGVLHALTGTMAASEKPLVDAVRLAVEEVNAAGGLLGRRVEVVAVDTRSDPELAAAEAERLVVTENVAALFGCWRTACRKAVVAVVERREHLLFYPLRYEGMESSRHVIYTGAAPNQQVVPGVAWALGHLGRRVYLVGHDYIFPRAANRIVSDVVRASGGTVLGERYVPIGSRDLSAVAEDVARLAPDVVVNTINGDSNAAFFAALRERGLAGTAILSLSVAEEEMRAYGGSALPRHYAVWSYFQSLPGEANARFVAAFRALSGPVAATSDPVEAAWVAVHLWAQAVREVGETDPLRVGRAVLHQSVIAPSGIVSVDASTRHVFRSVRVGKVRPDGSFEVVHDLGAPVRPNPFPVFRPRADWQRLAAELERRDWK